MYVSPSSVSLPSTHLAPQVSASPSGSGFRSRRSYPSLNHVSLAPLTNRFPIDDAEPEDYFSPRDERPADTPTRTSYLSSYSVPGTPGVLSYSRSGSRVRLHSRSKSSSRIHRSDSSLQSQDDAQPLHHHQHAPGSKKKRTHQPSESAGRRDAEWMLRAGIALASSTREEKGQSWLVKRESSTSLVSETKYDSPVLPRRSRSGKSTPAAHSRWGSRAASRRNSRPDLAMTSVEALSTRSGSIAHNSAGPDEETRHFPDFVDERIRAEMASIQQFEDGYASTEDEESDSEDEIDEQELQRLTRERGFGLGSWIDRMVAWTLFGVEDLPLSANAQSVQPAKHPDASPDENNVLDDHSSAAELTDDNASVSADESIASTVVEKPGESGGWEDAGWLLRVMKRALS
jgi:hypothetical protein